MTRIARRHSSRSVDDGQTVIDVYHAEPTADDGVQVQLCGPRPDGTDRRTHNAGTCSCATVETLAAADWNGLCPPAVEKGERREFGVIYRMTSRPSSLAAGSAA